MPQAGQRPHHQYVEHIAQGLHPVAAQRDIDIIPEPTAQRHVPAAPELGNAAGNEGRVKVFQQVEAENVAQTDGHIAVAREVEVNLQGKGGGVHPDKQYRGLGGAAVQLHQLTQLVGNEYLFGKADDEPAHAQTGLFHRMGTVLQLTGHVGIANDGAGDQLREHGHISTKVHDILLGLHAATVHINGVAEDLEGIKADADG